MTPLAEFRKALAVDANVLAAQQGVERTEPRAMLDAELRSYIEPAGAAVHARSAQRRAQHVSRAQAYAERGPVLEQQIATVTR